MSTDIRLAKAADLPALVALEERCFEGDRLSARSIKGFIREGAHLLVVLTCDERIVAYSLLLFRRGTLLSRLYSLALHADFRGRGLAQRLMADAEKRARARGCLFLRLEVRSDNPGAIRLYEKLGYTHFDVVEDYYEDGCSALRMEKPLLPAHDASLVAQAPDYYRQTTEFTCGPAALLMAMHRQRPELAMNRREELQLWREATTIYMCSGHGGCSPHGLALAALRRQFRVQLYISDNGTPFIDSVRQPEKRAVMEEVHRDFVAQLADYGAQVTVSPLDKQQFKQLLDTHDDMIALISTWALDRNRSPHWVYVHRADQHYVYMHDPDGNHINPARTDSHWQSESDFRHVPLAIDDFTAMASFGRRRLRCLLAITAL
ncbi:GNAT family N-acetyltransferase [Spongiibacter sp. KMU-166]|uniref:GNAT family N-acetyltransferase n=1 Tax=Spongiibacter thalassae TaxID=2721624 RepID=A0ABX1GD03_9GAMM|nr:peptidase C39 family protein [Spongiibacter thalassae]NKI17060.1 GNAT family N-acetyltransferase [Spongiibacter thalassae]